MQNFKSISIATLIICVILLNFVRAEKSMLDEKPYFTLRIETKNTLYLAKVNGVVVFDDNRSGDMLNAEIPVNYYMQSGINTISLNLFPNGDSGFEAASISLSLYVNKDEAPESDKKLISNIMFNGATYEKGTGIELSMPAMKLDSTNNFKKSDNGDVVIQNSKLAPGVIMPGTLTISQDIEVKTPFPKWGFLSGDDIDFPLSYKEFLDDPENWKNKTLKPLYAEYKNIYDLLNSKNIDKVMELFAERNNEYDIAMYYPKGTYEDKLKKSLTKDLANLTLKIRPPENGLPYISDSKKLLKLGSAGLLYFVNDSESSFTNYEILFYKKNGEWFVSR